MVELEVRDVDARTDKQIATVDFILHCRSCSDGDTGMCRDSIDAAVAHGKQGWQLYMLRMLNVLRNGTTGRRKRT